MKWLFGRSYKFEVSIEVEGKTKIEGVYDMQDPAMARAHQLIGTERYAAVRVHKVGKQGKRQLAFEHVRPARAKPLVVGEIDDAFVCRSVADVYLFGSRRTLSKVMRDYFDEHVMTPSELLHGHAALQELERDQVLVSAVGYRLAAIQGRKLSLQTDQRYGQLVTLFHDVIERARQSGRLAAFAEVLERDGLTGFLNHVDRNAAEDERARIVSYGFARRLEGIRDWNGKLDSLCALFTETQSDAALACLDEMLTEVFDGDGPIQATIGDASDLASALIALAAVADGSLDDRSAAAGVLQLSRIMATRPLPQLRAALLERVASALGGSAPLTRSGRQGDAAALRQLLPLLQEVSGLRGGSTMSAAVTRRASTAFGSNTADLPFEAAVATVTGLLPHPAAKLGYLLDLLVTDFARTNGTAITAGIDDLLSSVGSVHDLVPQGGDGLSPDDIMDGFRQRLYATRLPRKLADALVLRLAARADQAGPAPATIRWTATEDPLAPSTVPPARTVVSSLKKLGPIDPDAPTVFLAVSRVEPKLVLLHENEEYVIDHQREAFVMGRHVTCDLVVKSEVVSRAHAVITWQDGQFMLQDQSTNGTYIGFEGFAPIMLKRQQIRLERSGSIWLGVNPELASGPETPVIAFRVEQVM